MKRRIVFTKEEDALLVILVSKFGPTGNWNAIARCFGDRTGRQCRDRFNNYVSPHINKLPFSHEEDEYILKTVDEIGKKWAVIARCLNSRTDVSVKNRYNTLVSQLNIEPCIKMANETNAFKANNQDQPCNNAKILTVEPYQKEEKVFHESSSKDNFDDDLFDEDIFQLFSANDENCVEFSI